MAVHFRHSFRRGDRGPNGWLENLDLAVGLQFLGHAFHLLYVPGCKITSLHLLPADDFTRLPTQPTGKNLEEVDALFVKDANVLRELPHGADEKPASYWVENSA